MRRLVIGLSVFIFLTCAERLSAQEGFVFSLERAVAQQSFKGVAVSTLCQANNQLLRKQLAAFFQPSFFTAQPPKLYLPPADKPITFRVQETAVAENTASAFAIEVEGHLFGVTAGHVMKNISQQPYMYFQTQEGTFAAEKITSWRSTNANGTDVAVFEIPPAAREYVQVLSTAAQRARAQDVASIAGLAFNKPLWLPSEEILFANSHRLFLRRNLSASITGMCGSPVMVNGEVVGLYVGGYGEGTPSILGWPRLLMPISDQKLPALHLASPIENIFPLVDNLLGKSEQPAGTPLKVLGMQLAVLRPEDELFSINIVRNGQIQQTILAGELTDPEHLEHFLELQENDIVRVTIFHAKPLPNNPSISYHGINITTGQITVM